MEIGVGGGWQTLHPSLPFSTACPQFRPACPSGRRAEKLLTVADFVYELCHTKGRVNAGELAALRNGYWANHGGYQ